MNELDIKNLHIELNQYVEKNKTPFIIVKDINKEIPQDIFKKITVFDYYNIVFNNFYLFQILVKNINYSSKILNTKIKNTKTSFKRSSSLKFQVGELNISGLSKFDIINNIFKLLVDTKKKLLDNNLLVNNNTDKEFMKLVNDMITLTVILYESSFFESLTNSTILEIFKDNAMVFNNNYEIDLI